MKIAIRGCIAIQIFFAVFMVYMLRVTISINLLAMVRTGGNTTQNNSTHHSSNCASVSESNSSSGFEEGPIPLADYGSRYDWDRTEQGFVLGAYFYGYLIMCGPGGYIADKFGAARITLLSTFIGGVLTALIPLCAMVNVWMVIIIRFLTGFTGGVVYPAVQSLISRWAPPAEKGKFVAALMGNTLATCLTWPLLGAVIESFGWVWAFVIPGAISAAWSLIWIFTVADSPAEHKWITVEERKYISDNLVCEVKRVKRLPPYKKILTNVPFWALVILHYGNLWGLFLLLNNGPMYMKEALGFNITSSGALAALPYLARLTFGMIFGSIGDFIKRKEYMSVTFMRKFFCIFSHIIPGLLMFSVSLAGCNAPFAVTVIVLSLGFNGASTLTNLQNCQDLAPHFAGTIYGLVNCIGSSSGFITPSITSYITRERSSISEWNLIFAIGGCVYIGCALIYMIIGTGNVQDFNEVSEEKQ